VIKPDDPRQLATALLSRSICNVQVAAVIADKSGIFSWGWNHAGRNGFGEHAEAAAIRRANKKRLEYATVYVAAKRNRNFINSMPCPDCARLLRKYGIRTVHWTMGKGAGWYKQEWL
jgi:pyrimidine deaminase RibD-like protein